MSCDSNLDKQAKTAMHSARRCDGNRRCSKKTVGRGSLNITIITTSQHSGLELGTPKAELLSRSSTSLVQLLPPAVGTPCFAMLAIGLSCYLLQMMHVVRPRRQRPQPNHNNQTLRMPVGSRPFGFEGVNGAVDYVFLCCALSISRQQELENAALLAWLSMFNCSRTF